MRYRIWRQGQWGWASTNMVHRWKWLAALRAWEHEKRGWFKYEVRREA